MKKYIILQIIFYALISIGVSQSRATEIVVVHEYVIPPAATVDLVRAFYDWAIHGYADSLNAQVKAKKKKAGGDGGGGGGGNDEEVTLDCQGHKSDWGIQITCTPPNTTQPVVSCIARNPANFSPLELPRVNNGYGDMVRELLVSVVDIPTGRGANPGASIASRGGYD